MMITKAVSINIRSYETINHQKRDWKEGWNLLNIKWPNSSSIVYGHTFPTFIASDGSRGVLSRRTLTFTASRNLWEFARDRGTYARGIHMGSSFWCLQCSRPSSHGITDGMVEWSKRHASWYHCVSHHVQSCIATLTPSRSGGPGSMPASGISTRCPQDAGAVSDSVGMQIGRIPGVMT